MVREKGILITEFIISDKGRLLVKRIKFILLLLTCSGNKVSFEKGLLLENDSLIKKRISK